VSQEAIPQSPTSRYHSSLETRFTRAFPIGLVGHWLGNFLKARLLLLRRLTQLFSKHLTTTHNASQTTASQKASGACCQDRTPDRRLSIGPRTSLWRSRSSHLHRIDSPGQCCRNTSYYTWRHTRWNSCADKPCITTSWYSRPRRQWDSRGARKACCRKAQIRWSSIAKVSRGT
jgi:hypothetical protein